MAHLKIFNFLAIRTANIAINFPLSNGSAIFRSLAICPSPFSRPWLTVYHKVLLIGLNIEKLRYAGLLRMVCSRKS